MVKIAARSALITAGCLFGSMLLGLAAGVLVSGLPLHMPGPSQNALAAVPALLAVIAGGGLWGRAMGRVCHSDRRRAMTWAGALSVGPAFIFTALVLTGLEIALVEQGIGPSLPIYMVFTLLFVPATFLVAASGGLALGLAQSDRALALRLALGGGLAAALAFLIVNLAMDALGWRVGAPGAVQRATMVTVLALGALAASIAGGAAIGVLLVSFSAGKARSNQLSTFQKYRDPPNAPLAEEQS